MSEQLLHLSRRIQNELKELEGVVKRVKDGWQRAQRLSDDLYMDSVALNLHGFYAGVERLFELIASNIDGQIPQGANWHQLLLKQMADEVCSLRPAVLSEGTRDLLDQYRGFRHIVRNVYTFSFDPVKVQILVTQLSPVFDHVRVELLAFANFLEQKGKTETEDLPD
jgi:hypothetical protein